MNSDEKANPFPSDGRPVSPNEATSYYAAEARSYGYEVTVQLTHLSVRAISLYQKQAELTDRLWSYFGTNSAFATLVALIAPILSQNRLLPQSYFLRILLGLTILAYWAFSLGNRQSLKVSQEALERIAAQAQAASGIELKIIKPAKALLFHKVVSLVVTAIMIVGFVMATSALPRGMP